MKYQYSDSVQISQHFNSTEFRCKCGKEHDFEVNDNLVQKLEKLYAALNCSQIIVTSGFRCVTHDKNVGGSGTGQHTLGNAADICCYGQDGQPISSKTVCCKAQDIGFTGIANITAAYQYTHVDVRPNGKWYGDEVHGNSSVTDDFYKYFGGEDMKGIDVSVHNGDIDWGKVKADGIDFAILRAGYGKLAKQKDAKFEDNYKGAKAAGIPVGAYWYSYATTPDEAKLEAEVCVSILKGKQYEFPIFFDQEEKTTLDTGKANCSEMIRAFCDVLEANGYWVGLYTSRSCLTTHIEDDIKKRYALWAAEWSDKLRYDGPVGIWQHSEKGKVDGITGNVDLDIGYKDYPTMIKAKGLNGYGKAPDPTPAPDVPKENAVTVTVQIGDDNYSGTLTKV
jgi:GH25 family lysozyme M1 (1,4-beta-N-acetylmuramidase)